MTEPNKCELCGEPMSVGEEMFRYHGYSGGCPKPLKYDKTAAVPPEVVEAARTLKRWADLNDLKNWSVLGIGPKNDK